MPAGADAPEDKLGGLASQVIILHTNIIPDMINVIRKSHETNIFLNA
jgi:hypothetical protein